MAPTMAQTQSSSLVERQLRDIIQNLYEASVAISAADPNVPVSTDLVISQMNKMLSQYQELNLAKDNLDAAIPREIVMYVEDGRNPDIYTREFVEIIQKQNQFMNGKMRAFQSFRDVLAEQISTAFPDLTEDVDLVLKKTGGSRKPHQIQGGASRS